VVSFPLARNWLLAQAKTFKNNSRSLDAKSVSELQTNKKTVVFQQVKEGAAVIMDKMANSLGIANRPHWRNCASQLRHDCACVRT
jgi:hypothetical protein